MDREGSPRGFASQDVSRKAVRRWKPVYCNSNFFSPGVPYTGEVNLRATFRTVPLLDRHPSRCFSKPWGAGFSLHDKGQYPPPLLVLVNFMAATLPSQGKPRMFQNLDDLRRCNSRQPLAHTVTSMEVRLINPIWGTSSPLSRRSDTCSWMAS